MTDHESHKKVPQPLGGGTVGMAARKLVQRTEFQGVPQPELIAECVVRAIRDNNTKVRSALRVVINFYQREGKHPRFVEFLKKVHTNVR